MKLKENNQHDDRDHYRNYRFRYVSIRGKEKYQKKLRRRRVRIRRRFVKIKKVDFVARQRIFKV
jgi:hypothetical protein